MRVVIITPEPAAHHKHFCVRLAQAHDVVAVLHPASVQTGVGGKLRKTWKEMARSGVTYGMLRALATVRNPFLGWDWISAHDEAEKRFFPDAASSYEEVVSPIVHRVADVNAAPAIELIKGVAPDVVVCLGGPIYRKQLIDAAGLMINFHSGVSPIYNGASTIMFAFANGHFSLCGGTLMTMSATVDAGDILAHYLPAIDADDTPATLFMKTVRGAPDVCHRFLEHLDQARTFGRSRQPPALFYYTSSDFTIYHSQRIRRHLERKALVPHAREEELVEYWRRSSDEEAEASVRTTITRLLGLA